MHPDDPNNLQITNNGQTPLTVHELLIRQLAIEEQNSRIYRTFAGICDIKSLLGLSSWLAKQADGEQEHFQKIFSYMCDRDFDPALSTLPPVEYNREINVTEIFCQTVQLEKETLASLSEIKKTAIEVGDWQTFDFMDWFILEQVEEIKSTTDIKNRLLMAADSPSAILLIDHQLGD